jgi:hypothetical protein
LAALLASFIQAHAQPNRYPATSRAA